MSFCAPEYTYLWTVFKQRSFHFDIVTDRLIILNVFVLPSSQYRGDHVDTSGPNFGSRKCGLFGGIRCLGASEDKGTKDEGHGPENR